MFHNLIRILAANFFAEGVVMHSRSAKISGLSGDLTNLIRFIFCSINQLSNLMIQFVIVGVHYVIEPKTTKLLFDLKKHEQRLFRVFLSILSLFIKKNRKIRK
jgi:hypothetical protein